MFWPEVTHLTPMSAFFLIISPILIYIISFLRTQHRRRQPAPIRQRVILDTIPSIQNLLQPPHTSLYERLLQRSIPNARLIRAFNLHNTFTSPSIDLRKSFRREAHERLQPYKDHDGLKRLADLASTHLDAFIIKETRPRVPMAELVRFVTFCTVLSAFWNVDTDKMDLDDVEFVTDGINTLWCESKIKHESDERHVALLHGTMERLRKWIPMADTEGRPEDNPLNILIPAYETLWRVVGHTILEVYRAPSYGGIFDAFFEDPTDYNFDMENRTGQLAERPSPNAMITEVLRLYPPTRRISRAVHRDDVNSCMSKASCTDPSHRLVKAADVEAAQHSPSIWGPLSREFDPMRHMQKLSQEQSDSLMPFGYGDLKCIANTWAPKAAAIICGAITTERWRMEVIKGSGIGGREDWNGWDVKFGSMTE